MHLRLHCCSGFLRARFWQSWNSFRVSVSLLPHHICFERWKSPKKVNLLRGAGREMSATKAGFAVCFHMP